MKDPENAGGSSDGGEDHETPMNDPENPGGSSDGGEDHETPMNIKIVKRGTRKEKDPWGYSEAIDEFKKEKKKEEEEKKEEFTPDIDNFKQDIDLDKLEDQILENAGMDKKEIMPDRSSRISLLMKYIKEQVKKFMAS